MAYKSQVTNKRMGSSFQGRVNPGRENELTQLAQSLEEFSDALPKGINAYKNEQVKKAEEQLEYLRTTMEPEELQAYILKGEDPILSNQFAVSVVEGQTGRFHAADVINQIKRNYNSYNYEDGTLRGFYKNYIPDMSTKSSAYRNGFSVAFNNWAADEYIRDAEFRAEKAQEKKFSGARTLLSTVTDINEYWETVASLNSRMPNDGGENYFFTTDEMNELVMQDVRGLILNATSLDDFDKAQAILLADRGIGKGGNKLGSLLSTNREDVDKLNNDLASARFAFERRQIQTENYNEQQAISDIFNDAFLNKDLTDPTQVQNIKMELAKIDATTVVTFERLVDITRDNAVGEDAKKAFLLGIAQQEYDYDIQQLVSDFESARMPLDFFPQVLSTWNDAHRRSRTNEAAVYERNSEYANGTTDVLNAVKSSFTFEGILQPNYYAAAYNAKYYIQSEILAFEASFEEQYGRPITQEDRRQFMNRVGKFVIDNFTRTQMADPNIPDFRSIDEMDAEIARNQQTFSDVVDQMAGSPLRVFDTAEINQQMADFIRDDGASNMEVLEQKQQAYLSENVYPLIIDTVLKSLPSYLQDDFPQFIDRLVSNSFAKSKLAASLGIDSKILHNALAQARAESE
ncbi:MAG: hypothetical protein CMD62_06160 [Gammaproteobacteria bacterium]|nr:hypothetical protein [Gammaproteobacteria bacterium]